MFKILFFNLFISNSYCTNNRKKRGFYLKNTEFSAQTDFGLLENQSIIILGFLWYTVRHLFFLLEFVLFMNPLIGECN
jgi:hypothetical protein